jgi:hypothetical protein
MTEYGRTWKIAVVAYSQEFSWYLLGGTEKNNGYLNKGSQFPC